MIRLSRSGLALIGGTALAFVLGCDSNEITGQVVQNSLVVVTTCPESGDTTMAVSTRPYVDFDIAPDTTSRPTTSFVVEHAGAAVPGGVLTLGRRWVFVPDQSLDTLSYYTCSVAVGVRLVKGHMMRDFVRWTFRTGKTAATDTCKVS